MPLDMSRGSFFLCKALNCLSGDPQMLIAASSMIIFPAIGYFLYKNAEDVVLASYLFVTLLVFAACMNFMRQAMAIAVVLCGFQFFLRKDRKLLFLASVVLASSFHQTALVAATLLVMVLWKFSKLTMVLYCGLMTAFLVLPDLMFELAASSLGAYEAYASTHFANANYFGAVIRASFFALLALAVLYRGDDEGIAATSATGVFGPSFSRHCAMTTLTLLVAAIQTEIIGRVYLYFSVFFVVAVSNVIIRFASYERFLYRYGIVLSSFVYAMTVLLLRPEWYRVTDYCFFWIA